MSYRAEDYEFKPGKSRFRQWHAKLPGKTAAIIDVAVRKLEFGNFNSAKNIKDGVYECSIDTGPGYRVYFGLEGHELIILLAGGTKRNQQKDIDQAKADWKEYKQRKAAEVKQTAAKATRKNKRHNRREGDK